MSVTLVVLLVAGGFAGFITFVADEAAAVGIVMDAGPAAGAAFDFAPAAPIIAFEFTITFEQVANALGAMNPAETNPQCTYTFNGVDIAAEIFEGGVADDDCAAGANQNEKEWRPAAANVNWDGNEVQSAITVTVTVQDAMICADPVQMNVDPCDPNNNMATVATSNFIVDDRPPSSTNDAVRLFNNLGEVTEAEFASANDLIGGPTFSIEMQNANPPGLIDGFLDQIDLRRCSGGTPVGGAPLRTLDVPPFGTTPTFSGLTAADLVGNTNLNNNHATGFQLTYIDSAGNSATSPSAGCFTFHLDNQGPTVNWLGAAPTVFIADFTFSQGTHFSASDANGLGTAASDVQLSWAGATPGSANSGGANPALTLLFPASTLTPDVYTQTITARDIFGNVGSQQRNNIKADPDAPELVAVRVDDGSGGCAETDFAPGGNPVDTSTEFCSGTYSVKLQISERFPGTLTIESDDFDFPGVPTPTTDAGDATLKTWTFNGVVKKTDVDPGAAGNQAPVAPFTFGFTLEEEGPAPLDREITFAKTEIGFRTADTPIVNFDPATTIFDNGEAEFSVTWVSCPAGALAANQFCIPNVAPGNNPPTVELINTAGSSTVIGTFTENVNNHEWSVTRSVAAGSGEVIDVTVRVTNGVVRGEAAPPVAIVIDNADPDMDDPAETAITIYEWDPDGNTDADAATIELPDGGWKPVVGANTATIAPLKGPYLVKFKYSSFSAREITFRFIDEDTVGDPQEVWAEWTFLVENAGTNAGKGHRDVPEGDQKVFLARGLDANDIDDLTAGSDAEDNVFETGCITTGGRLLLGSPRECYFFVNLGTVPTARSSGSVNVVEGTDYVIQPIISEDREFERTASAANDPKFGPSEESDMTLSASFTPALGASPTIEIGVTTTLKVTVDGQATVGGNDAELAQVHVWVCAIRPGLDQPFDRYSAFSSASGAAAQTAPWDNEPDCEFLRNPTSVPFSNDPDRVRAVQMALVPIADDEDRERELAFTLSNFLCEDAAGDDVACTAPNARSVDRLYFRVIARDRWGNFKELVPPQANPVQLVERRVDRAHDPPAAAPTNPLTVYRNCLGSGVPRVPADCTRLTDAFRDDTSGGCLQADGLDNVVDLDNDNRLDNDFGLDVGPCFQILDNVPDALEGYPKFLIPVLLENFGNAADNIVVTYQHRAGRGDWTVTVSETGEPGNVADAQGEELIVAGVPARRSLTEPTRQQIVVEIQPDPQALGGDFKTIDLRIKSGESKAPGNTPSSFFITAQLLALDRGEILFGQSEILEVDDKAPEDIFDVPFTLTNTGNARNSYSVEIDPRTSRSTPSSIADGAGGFHPLCQIGGAPLGTDRESFILLDVQRDDDGSGASSLIMSPGQREELQFRVDVGRNVPASTSSPHRCTFQVLAETDATLPGLEVVPISPLDPTLRLDIVGEAALRIFELQAELFNEEIDVTGEELVRFVPPTATFHDVILYFENAGTIAIEPEITSFVEVLDPFSLNGRWEGVSPTGTPLDEAAMREPFLMPRSDIEDDARIKDLTNDAGRFVAPELDATLGDGRWECGRDDLSTPPDNEDRILCRVHLRYLPPVDLVTGLSKAVSGDQVVFDFAWEDRSVGGTPTALRIRLVFEHVGQTDVSTLTAPVVAREQRSRVTFVTNLVEGREFDLATRTSVPSTVEFTYMPDVGAPLECVEKFNGAGVQPHTAVDGTIFGPDSQSETNPPTTSTAQAFFDVPVVFTTTSAPPAGDPPCRFEVRTNGDWAFTVPPASAPGILETSLFVGDQDSSAARVLHPANVRFIDRTTAVPIPADATRLSITPSADQDANGRQFARFSFDPAGGTASVPPAGVLLSRGSGLTLLEPFVDCRVAGNAVTTAGGDTITVNGVTGPLAWGRLGASLPSDAANPFAAPGGTFDMDLTTSASSATQKIVGASHDVHGMLLRRQTVTIGANQVPQALHVGNVHVYTWGVVDPAGVFHPAWREGVNPIVFYVEDADATDPSPAQGGAITTVSTEFSFLLRDDDAAPNDKITDRFKTQMLSGSTDAVRNLGGGFWSMDLVLPEGIGAGGELLPGRVLADHRFDQSFTQMPYAAFALRFNVQSGRSLGGDDLTGDAFWRLDDLEMLAGAPVVSAAKGSSGTSAILDGGKATARTDLTPVSTSNPATQAHTFMHRAFAFGIGPSSPARGEPAMPWVTGPGIHTLRLGLMEEQTQPNTNGIIFGELASPTGEETIKSELTPFREHTLAPSTQGRATARIEPFDRPLAGNSIVSLSSSGTTTSGMAAMYSAIANLFDTGQESTEWRFHMTISDSQSQRQTMTGQVRVLAGRQSSSNGLPMPLCIQPPANIFADGIPREIGEFDLEELGGLRIVDTRAIPGLVPDRGQFSLTPFVTDLAGGLPLGFNHDDQESFRIIGAGLATIDSANIPRQAEEDVPIPISAKVTGVVRSVTAVLEKDGVVVEEKTLTLVDGLYVGTLTPTELGAHRVRIRAEDVAGDVTSQTVDVEVVGNAPPRISFTKPVEVGGARAIKPGDTIEVTVTDKSITAAAITVMVRDSAGAFQTVTEGVSISCGAGAGLCTVTYAPPNAADGDSIVMKVRAVIADDDQAESDATTIKVDGTAPNVALTIGSPKITGTPTIVGPATEVTVAANDAGTLGSMLIRAVRDGTTVGSHTFPGTQGGDVVLSALGLTEDGVTATLIGVAEDVAGNSAETTPVSVRVDASGPTFSEVTGRRAGTGVQLFARVADPSGLGTVTAFFRRPSESQFTSIPMEEQDGRFQAIVTNAGSSGQLRFFMRANDALGNTGNYRDSGTPDTVDLGGGGAENRAPVIVITSPTQGETVKREITVAYDVSDPDGDPVTVTSAKAGDGLTLDPTRRSLQLDTRELPEGSVDIVISATDGVTTTTETVSVIVDNQPKPVPCDVGSPLVVGSSVPVCFAYEAPPDTASVKVELLRNGQPLETRTLDVQDTDSYRATFPIEDDGTYALRITPIDSAGAEGEPTVSEPFQVQNKLGDLTDKPLVSFVIALVLGAVVLGVAAFGAFGRWK